MLFDFSYMYLFIDDPILLLIYLVYLISNQKVYKKNYKILEIILLIIIFLITVITTLSYIVKIKKIREREKINPFECGFDPAHKIRSSFSLRFFLITILFLIFDVEIAVLLAIPRNNRLRTNKKTLFNNLIIFIILSGGLFIEWRQGALTWSWVYI